MKANLPERTRPFLSLRTFQKEEELLMKIAITTPTGKVGSAVTDRLLESSHELILLARDPKKIKSFTDRGATVQAGSLGDKAYVVNATRGVDVLFWVIPPDFTSDDYRAHQNEMGDNAVAAIRENKIPRVVNLSSVGAQFGEGVGPISGLRDVERKFDTTDAHVTHLRPGYFMENFLMAVPTVASDGAIYLPMPGTARNPFVAVADIAKTAAELVQDESWTGKSTVELVGPADVSFDEAAQTIGSAIGKEVSHFEASSGQMLEALAGMGVSQNVAETYVEMYDAFRGGKVGPETEPKRGATTFKAFAEQVFRPGFEAITK
jgi:uncharacterized protein YbjT (DUF2867 family)